MAARHYWPNPGLSTRDQGANDMTQGQKILVLGASGKTGNATAMELLGRGEPVRAFVRKEDKRSEALRAAGAEIFRGELSNFGDISKALVGVDKAYFIAPWVADQMHLAATFAVAAAQSDLKLIVTITQWLAHPHHPSQATRWSYLTDNIFDMIPGVDVVKINTGWFADNYLLPELLAMVTQLGIFPFPLGEGKTAPVSNEDIGRVAAEALANPVPYIGKTIRPTGPRLMSPQDLVESFSRVTGRTVKYDNISEKLFLKSLQFMKIPVHFQAQVRRYVEDYSHGSFEIGAPNDVVLEMTGKPAEDFDTIIKRYIKRHDDVTRRSVGNKLKAIRGFVKLVFTGAVDLDKLEIEREYPLVIDPQFSIDSSPWLQSHDEQHPAHS
jgi:NAD(P)H dehydrogenase (quinone)